MSINKALFNSDKEDWETPDDLFNELDKEFHFECDVAASTLNNKCKIFFSKEPGAFYYAWYKTNWCNPPYGDIIKDFCKKATYESRHGNTTVMLLPARTDVKWFHEYIYNKNNVEIRFLKGRLKFKGAKHSAPFPSMIVIFRGVNNGL